MKLGRPNAEQMKELLSGFYKSKSTSGYQIFDITKRQEFTEVVANLDDLTESTIIYDEVKPTSAIVRAKHPESIRNFLDYLSGSKKDSFLLFVETNFPESDVVSLVGQYFNYDFYCRENLLSMTPERIQPQDGLDRFKGASVRTASPKDLDDILAVYDQFNERAYTESQYSDQIRNRLIQVLEVEGDIAGTVTFHTADQGISIMGGFRIGHRYQERGFGKFFLSEVSNNVLQTCEQIVSYTPADNVPMVSLRSKVGYESIESRLAFAIQSSLRPIGLSP